MGAENSIINVLTTNGPHAWIWNVRIILGMIQNLKKKYGVRERTHINSCLCNLVLAVQFFILNELSSKKIFALAGFWGGIIKVYSKIYLK